MLLPVLIHPLAQVVRGAASPDVTDVISRMAVPGIAAIGLLVAMLWLARKARHGLGSETAQSGGEATSAALLLVLAQRERELAGASATTHGTRRPLATPSALPSLENAAGAEEAPGRMYDGPVHCPACATQLGVAGPALRYVTRCPACARWIASRVEGQRVIVEARKG